MTIIKAKFSRLLDRAENPTETLDYSYEEQLRQLQNVKRGIADVTTAKKRLEMQYTRMQQQVDKLDGQAQAGAEGEPRGSRARGADAQGGGAGAARRDHAAGPAARGAAAEARRGREDALGEGRVVPHAEGSDQGAVLGRRGAGADRRGRDRHRRATWPTSASRSQRAKDKTQQMQARANAIDELTAAGRARRTSPRRATTSTGSSRRSQQGGQVDDELAKMKAELGRAATAEGARGRGKPT